VEKCCSKMQDWLVVSRDVVLVGVHCRIMQVVKKPGHLDGSLLPLSRNLPVCEVALSKSSLRLFPRESSSSCIHMSRAARAPQLERLANREVFQLHVVMCFLHAKRRKHAVDIRGMVCNDLRFILVVRCSSLELASLMLPQCPRYCSKASLGPLPDQIETLSLLAMISWCSECTTDLLLRRMEWIWICVWVIDACSML
jgi:hypothetical protein